jgi:hypothetical protein
MPQLELESGEEVLGKEVMEKRRKARLTLYSSILRSTVHKPISLFTNSW